MSRTIRKPNYYVGKGEIFFIEKAIAYWKSYPYTYRRVARSEEEVKLAQQKIDADYVQRVRLCAKDENGYYYEYGGKKYYINPGKASLYHKETFPVSKEEAIKKAKKDYAEHFRDGHANETSRNKFFKELSKKEVRNETKRLVAATLKDEDYDKPYPADYLGDKHVWSVW